MKCLKDLLKQDGMVVAPGGYDGLTAKLIEQAGFGAAYMGGANTSARFGFPDFGLLTMSDMVDNAAIMARSVNIPVIADADTGYGNELNVVRTIQAFERAGVAAVHIEDQGFPKRCGHLDDKEIIALDEYLPKIRAAVWARSSSDFLIIARTDARAALGLNEAIARANAAIEAGADMAFVEAPQSLEEMAAVVKQVKGPCLLNVVRGGKSPDVDLAWAETIGYKLAIVPSLLMRNVIGICDQKLAELREKRAHPAPIVEMNVVDTFRRVGSDYWSDLRTRFRGPRHDEPGA